MSGFEAIVTDGAGGRDARVDDGGPALELVMAVAMEKIGSADGDAGACDFDGGECRMIVHDVVGEENFLAAAAAHIERGRIIEGARSGDSGEEQIIRSIPKAMRAGLRRVGFRGGVRCRVAGLAVRRDFHRGKLRRGRTRGSEWHGSGEEYAKYEIAEAIHDLLRTAGFVNLAGREKREL